MKTFRNCGGSLFLVLFFLLNLVPGFSETHTSLEDLKTQIDDMDSLRKALLFDGWTGEIRDLNTERSFHTFSRSLVFSKPGTSQEELIVLLPLDNADLSFRWTNILAARILMDEASKAPLPFSLTVGLLGGESENRRYGSREFLRRFLPAHPAAFIYGDFSSMSGALEMIPGSNEMITPRKWYKAQYEAFVKAGWNLRTPANLQQLFRLNLGDAPSPAAPFLQRGYGALSVHSRSSKAPGDPREWETLVRNLIPRWTEGLSSRDFQDHETHYLTISLGKQLTIIPEKAFIASLLFILGTVILYPLIAVKRSRRYARILWDKAWTLGIIFLVIFLAFSAGTGLSALIVFLKGTSHLWQNRGPLLFLLKILSALLILALTFRQLKRLPLSRNGSFYSAAALLFFLLDIFIIGSLNIAMAYIALASYFMGFLFSLAPDRISKLIILPLTMILPGKLFWNFFQIPSYKFIRGILLSPGLGDLVLTLFLLPYIFLIIRISLMFHLKKENSERVNFGMEISLGAAVLGLILTIWFLPVYTDSNPRRLILRETIDQKTLEKSLTIRGDRYSDPEKLIPRDYSPGEERRTGMTAQKEWKAPLNDQVVRWTTETQSFLNRTIHRFRIRGIDGAREIQLRVKAGEEMDGETLVYDASFPFIQNPDGSSAEIFIGGGAPDPLDLELILPRGFTGELTLTARFDRLLLVPDFSIPTGEITAETTLRVPLLERLPR